MTASWLHGMSEKAGEVSAHANSSKENACGFEQPQAWNSLLSPIDRPQGPSRRNHLSEAGTLGRLVTGSSTVGCARRRNELIHVHFWRRGCVRQGPKVVSLLGQLP